MAHPFHLRGVSLSAVLLAACCGTALAQDPGFVLFPNAPQLSLYPNPDAKKQAAAQPEDQQFVHPITAPYYNEDSFVTTDVRAWYLYHSVSDGSLLNGGEAQVAAAQIRLALTDQLQLVAYKDGYTFIHTGLIKKDGWNDIAAGLKWNFLQDYQHELFASAGVGYQFPFGESDALQNKEALRAWLSLDKGFGPIHIGATVNYLKDTGAQGPFGASQQMSEHLHLDYYLCKYFSPVLEFNAYEQLTHHNAALPIQGADVTLLGGGTADFVGTLALGFEVRPVKKLAIRAAFERNLFHPNDLFDNRMTLSAVLSF